MFRAFLVVLLVLLVLLSATVGVRAWDPERCTLYRSYDLNGTSVYVTSCCQDAVYALASLETSALKNATMPANGLPGVLLGGFEASHCTYIEQTLKCPNRRTRVKTTTNPAGFVYVDRVTPETEFVRSFLVISSANHVTVPAVLLMMVTMVSGFFV